MVTFRRFGHFIVISHAFFQNLTLTNKELRGSPWSRGNAYGKATMRGLNLVDTQSYILQKSNASHLKPIQMQWKSREA